ncbi:hypothetical protein Hanom_Chr02g00163041 [Helianthus anomalus]
MSKSLFNTIYIPNGYKDEFRGPSLSLFFKNSKFINKNSKSSDDRRVTGPS